MRRGGLGLEKSLRLGRLWRRAALWRVSRGGIGKFRRLGERTGEPIAKAAAPPASEYSSVSDVSSDVPSDVPSEVPSEVSSDAPSTNTGKR